MQCIRHTAALYMYICKSALIRQCDGSVTGYVGCHNQKALKKAYHWISMLIKYKTMCQTYSWKSTFMMTIRDMHRDGPASEYVGSHNQKDRNNFKIKVFFGMLSDYRPIRLSH